MDGDAEVLVGVPGVGELPAPVGLVSHGGAGSSDDVRLLLVEGLVALFAVACAPGDGSPDGDGRSARDAERARRVTMVSSPIEARGVQDARVLEAMRNVPRHLFVPRPLRAEAYRDGPLSIGRQQTISQPYIVALMTELMRPEPSMRVLEIGTGSGYQAAVLAECVEKVFTIEIIPELGRLAAARLDDARILANLVISTRTSRAPATILVTPN